MRISILIFALLLAGCDTSHVSEGIGPFRNPAAVAREAAIAARDPQKAETAMRRHIEAVRDGLFGVARAVAE